MQINTVYEHETGASRIVAVEQWDGSTDIMISHGMGTMYEDVMRYPLPNHECDKLGAVLCKDIINNYRKHNDYLKQRYEDSQTTIRDGINEHNKHAHQLYARIEYLEAINKGLVDDTGELKVVNAILRRNNETNRDKIHRLHGCREAFFKLLDQRSELEATNRGLEQDIENLRIANELYRKRWSESENESTPSESHANQL